MIFIPDTDVSPSEALNLMALVLGVNENTPLFKFTESPIINVCPLPSIVTFEAVIDGICVVPSVSETEAFFFNVSVPPLLLFNVVHLH